jgi:hypothetical protein
LHQPGAAARDDVAAQEGQLGREAFDLIVRIDAGSGARRPEDAHAVVRPLTPPQPGELGDHVPQSGDRSLEHVDGGTFVAQQDDVGLSMNGCLFGHRSAPLSRENLSRRANLMLEDPALRTTIASDIGVLIASG